MAYTPEIKVFSGTASAALTSDVCEYLGVDQGEAVCDRFSDGEVKVQLGENVRGRDVFIVNSTSPPVNDHLMELLTLIDAARRASAARVTAVLPYFGYARQDRKERSRVPITAKLVSNLITAAGANRVLTVDLHCGQIQGFFDIPVDHLTGDVVFVKHFMSLGADDMVVVSPDTGSVHRVRDFARRLNVPLAIIDKRRPEPNVAEVMNVIGDVQGKRALICDDLIDTGGTLIEAADAIKERGAKNVKACATHPVFSGPALDRIRASVLDEVLVSDSIPLCPAARDDGNVRVVSIAPLIGEAIRRVHHEESVSSLYR